MDTCEPLEPVFSDEAGAARDAAAFCASISGISARGIQLDHSEQLDSDFDASRKEAYLIRRSWIPSYRLLGRGFSEVRSGPKRSRVQPSRIALKHPVVQFASVCCATAEAVEIA